MARRYKDDRKVGVTTNRSEARANRYLQLVHSSSAPLERGRTLIEQMEEKLDETMQARQTLLKERDSKVQADESSNGQAHWSDDLEDEYLDSMLKNEGKIQGMLVMLGIMRSTNMKVELARSKARMKFNG